MNENPRSWQAQNPPNKPVEVQASVEQQEKEVAKPKVPEIRYGRLMKLKETGTRITVIEAAAEERDGEICHRVVTPSGKRLVVPSSKIEPLYSMREEKSST